MTAPPSRPPYGWAGLVALAALVIYVVTLAPTTAFWDTSEYIAAAYTLGIPHPPGNPLFTVLAHAWGLLPLAESYAVRINLFAAVTSAAAAGLWFLVAERWLRELVPVRWARLAAAAAGVLVSATMWTTWNQSTVNEKVYTVSLLSMALVLWLVVHWGDDLDSAHRDRWLVLIAFVLALTSTNHQMGVLVAPALLVYVLFTDWRVVTRPWAVATGVALLFALSGGVGHLGAVVVGTWGAAQVPGLTWLLLAALAGSLGWGLVRDPRHPLPWLGVLAVLVGVSLNYIYLPMRAGQFPAINEGEPTGYFSQALLEMLGRVQYQKPPVTERQADLVAQGLNYLQYFSWQFARDWGRWAVPLAALFGLLGLGGLAALVRRDRRAGLAAVAMFATLTVALVVYLNFKYGFSIYPERTGLAREVRERDYFFVGSFAYFGVLVALGFGTLMRALAELLRRPTDTAPNWLLASPVLALALIPLFGNVSTASRAGESVARATALDLLHSVEPYGILITAGDNDTFPLWYAQEVEGVRRDVTIANLSLMNTRWHLRQLNRHVPAPFDPAAALPLWRQGDWSRPTTPVFRLTEAGLDSLPDIAPAPEGGSLQLAGLDLRLGQDYLVLQDIATLLLMRDNIGRRPIHFSWSAAGYPDQTFGLTPYLATQGLVRKLLPTPVVPGDSLVLSDGLGYLDLARTRELLASYDWEAVARPRRHGWVDEPSASMLYLYQIVYDASASTFAAQGHPALAARADSIAARISAALVPQGRPTLGGPVR